MANDDDVWDSGFDDAPAEDTNSGFGSAFAEMMEDDEAADSGTALSAGGLQLAAGTESGSSGGANSAIDRLGRGGRVPFLGENAERPADDEDDEPTDVTPRGILEAMLFVGHADNQALKPSQVAALVRGVEPDEVHALVKELNERYAAEGRAYEIVQADAGYRMVLRRELHAVRDRFHGRLRESRLSMAAVEVLSIVAYNEPLTAEQVQKFRSQPSGSHLSQLVRRGLLRIERQAEKGASALYFTTPRFLQLFGLARLEDLPRDADSNLL